MSISWKYLPPLASDFSGVSSILFGMNSLNIIYSPGSCDGPIVEVDEIRDLNDRSFFTTKLSDVDIVVGIEKKLIKALEDMDLNEFEFISILGTPIANLTGVSLGRICSSLERKFNIPVIFFETSGFESYPIGVSEGFLKLGEKLIDRFINDIPTVDEINILGYTPLALGDESHLKELITLLKENAFHVNIFGGSEANLNSMRLSSKAKLNIVISEEGMALAQFLREKYGIPHILKLPVGITEMHSFVNRIEQMLGITIKGKAQLEYNNRHLNWDKVIINKNVFIIGEPFVSLAIKECLQKDFGIKNISIMSNIQKRTKSQTLFLEDRYDEVKCLESETQIAEDMDSTDIVIADPLYERFLPQHSKIKFIPIPHLGLSGREFAHMDYEYIGSGGFNYFKRHLEKL